MQMTPQSLQLKTSAGKKVIKELDTNEQAAGAKINSKKTYGLWTGKWKNRPDNPMNITWTSGNVKVLGIYLGNEKPNEYLLKRNI